MKIISHYSLLTIHYSLFTRLSGGFADSLTGSFCFCCFLFLFGSGFQLCNFCLDKIFLCDLDPFFFLIYIQCINAGRDSEFIF